MPDRFGFFCFWHAYRQKSTASYMGALWVTKKTALPWMHKVREAMESTGNNPMEGGPHGKFVLSGRKKDRIAGATMPRKEKP